jgi:hypothetical protein
VGIYFLITRKVELDEVKKLEEKLIDAQDTE